MKVYFQQQAYNNINGSTRNN